MQDECLLTTVLSLSFLGNVSNLLNVFAAKAAIYLLLIRLRFSPQWQLKVFSII